ncbi:hypothetical protein MTBBW1_2500014 [Desulfamplus magnetovallimortis]|uniref:Uncharacterized protein n=1 Tax=Desulfamplus magnetovallimortis TaxID=1246637 RepID=A0A1W1HER1_9BACT|nr:hypothetical protein MTBBW1_2500014 [Desulfamplus magnetovallimortis]
MKAFLFLNLNKNTHTKEYIHHEYHQLHESWVSRNCAEH